MSNVSWIDARGSAVLLALILGLFISGTPRAENDSGGLAQSPQRLDIPPGYALVGGDMILPDPALHPASTYEPSLWPGGVIPCEFNANVTPSQQLAAWESMAVWESVATVSFISRTSEPNYIHFMDSFQNAAPVGMNPGKNTVHIYNWNRPTVPANNSHIIVHELGHVLGYYHEHRRADRGSYIQILWSHIAPGRTSDFQVVTSPAAAYGPYDFDSLMHGPECHETRCPYCPSDPIGLDTCRTILVLPPYDTEWQSEIGQLDHVSEWDARTMSFLYPESDWRFVDWANTGSTLGTFLEPYTQFPAGVAAVPSGGTVWVQPGSYSSVGTYNKAMRIEAPRGGVSLGP